jgi:hypothetical protein
MTGIDPIQAEVEEALDAIDWLKVLLSNHVRTRTIKLTVRTFQLKGVQYKCGQGPWRNTLTEAIMAGQRDAPRPCVGEGGGTT